MVRWSMASALFLGSWAVMMGPLMYGEYHTLPSCCSFATPSFFRAQSKQAITLVSGPHGLEWLRQSEPHRTSIGTTNCDEDGALIVRNSAPPTLPRETSLHSNILWKYCAYAVLRRRGKSIRFLQLPWSGECGAGGQLPPLPPSTTTPPSLPASTISLCAAATSIMRSKGLDARRTLDPNPNPAHTRPTSWPRSIPLPILTTTLPPSPFSHAAAHAAVAGNIRHDPRKRCHPTLSGPPC
jgi:hypothetical protein